MTAPPSGTHCVEHRLHVLAEARRSRSRLAARRSRRDRAGRRRRPAGRPRAAPRSRGPVADRLRPAVDQHDDRAAVGRAEALGVDLGAVGRAHGHRLAARPAARSTLGVSGSAAIARRQRGAGRRPPRRPRRAPRHPRRSAPLACVDSPPSRRQAYSSVTRPGARGVHRIRQRMRIGIAHWRW